MKIVYLNLSFMQGMGYMKEEFKHGEVKKNQDHSWAKIAEDRKAAYIDDLKDKS